jgi:hypothetical protein
MMSHVIPGSRVDRSGTLARRPPIARGAQRREHGQSSERKSVFSLAPRTFRSLQFGLVPRVRVFLRVVAFVLVAAAMSGMARNAAGLQLTTAPGALADIRVVITEHVLEINHGASAPRGSSATFFLQNDTGSIARFLLLGRESKPIAPHASGRFSVFLLRRGAYVAKVELTAHSTLLETFVVY